MITLWWKVVEFFSTEFLFLLYRGVMWLKKNRAELRPWQRYPAYIFVAFGYLCDVLYQVFIGTVQFRDLPRELTYTARLKRYKTIMAITSKTLWRFDKAVEICNRLNPHDPSGKHC